MPGCVKLDVGIPFRTRAWPRSGIRSRLFHWRIIHGYRWKFDSHINLLELQAVVNALQWRLRSVSRFRHRVLHLVDSQVVASIVAKGRTSSFRLRKAVDKLSSIAGGVQLAIGYVASEENPADIPSMGKTTKKQGEAHRQERKRQRAGQRYQLAVRRILRFWKECRRPSTSWDDVDMATAQWLEHIFSEGYPKGYGSDGLAALRHFLPELAGKLRHSWRLLKSWQKVEPPCRALPSPLMVTAISQACALRGYVDCAAAFLVAFDTLLRPGELYRLTIGDITWAGGKAVLSLKNTKFRAMPGCRRNGGVQQSCS